MKLLKFNWFGFLIKRKYSIIWHFLSLYFTFQHNHRDSNFYKNISRILLKLIQCVKIGPGVGSAPWWCGSQWNCVASQVWEQTLTESLSLGGGVPAGREHSGSRSTGFSLIGRLSLESLAMDAGCERIHHWKKRGM